MTAAGALARACHPLPSLAVTVFAVALGVAAGAGWRSVLLGAAVLTGQLSIGWLNDLVDADVDAEAGRTTKPVAAGEVGRTTVRSAVFAAAVACVGLSLALGVLPGLLHLLAVAGAWAYDLGLKRTAASPAPFALSFGLLPAIAATTAGATAPWSLLVAAGLLGAAAHFANTVPDAVADAVTGVRGLPQRIGPRRSQVVAAAGVVAACAVVLVVQGRELPLVGTALLAASSAVAAWSPFAPGHLSFRLVLGAAALAVAGVVAAG